MTPGNAGAYSMSASATDPCVALPPASMQSSKAPHTVSRLKAVDGLAPSPLKTLKGRECHIETVWSELDRGIDQIIVSPPVEFGITSVS